MMKTPVKTDNKAEIPEKYGWETNLQPLENSASIV